MSQFPAFQAYRDAVSKAWDQSRMTLSDSAPPCDDRAVSERFQAVKDGKTGISIRWVREYDVPAPKPSVWAGKITDNEYTRTVVSAETYRQFNRAKQGKE